MSQELSDRGWNGGPDCSYRGGFVTALSRLGVRISLRGSIYKSGSVLWDGAGRQ